jgi:hypothetical protein
MLCCVLALRLPSLDFKGGKEYQGEKQDRSSLFLHTLDGPVGLCLVLHADTDPLPVAGWRDHVLEARALYVNTLWKRVDVFRQR